MYPAGQPATPVRGASGTPFAVNTPLINNGAFIRVNPGPGGLITAQATVTFLAASGNFAYMGLDPPKTRVPVRAEIRVFAGYRSDTGVFGDRCSRSFYGDGG